MIENMVDIQVLCEQCGYPMELESGGVLVCMSCGYIQENPTNLDDESGIYYDEYDS